MSCCCRAVIALACTVFSSAMLWSAPARAAQIDGPSAIAVTSSGAIVVARSDPDFILVFAPDAHGNAAPRRAIGGYRSDLYSPRAAAVDASDEIFALIHRNGCDGIVKFADGANGDVMPATEIFGTKTGLCEPVSAMTVNAQGGVYVAHDDGDKVVYFPPGSDGNVAPSAELFGVNNAALHGVRALAVDGDGDLLVADVREKTENSLGGDSYGNITSPDIHYHPDIRIFDGNATDDAVPATVIEELVWTIGAAGRLVLAIPASGPSPLAQVDLWLLTGTKHATIAGARTTLVAPVSVAGDENGQVYVLDDRCAVSSGPSATAAIVIFGGSTYGDAAPARTIAGSKTSLKCP